MINRILLCLLGCLIVFNANAKRDATGTIPVWQVKTGWEADFSLGVRKDHFDWNIASDLFGVTAPNVLSELQWDLEMIEFGINLRWFPRESTFAMIDLIYAQAYDGTNQDSDYLGDNRTLEFSRSNNNAEGSEVFNYKLAIGVRLGGRPNTWSSSTSIIPMLGYASNSINLEMKDGYQTIATTGVTPPAGPFPGLNSSYDADWTGPFFGLQLYHDASRDYRLFLNYYYHDVNYEAEAVWNLRSDFRQDPSFIQEAQGTGKVYELGVIFNVMKGWTTTLKYRNEDWQADAGIDITYFSDNTIGGTRLNEVNWESSTVSLSFYKRY